MTTLRVLGTILGGLAQTARELAAEAAWDPVPGSIAHTELQAQPELVDSWSDEPVEGAYSLARLALYCAEDHLLAIEQLLRVEDVQRYAIETIVRTVIEASARAWWLLDPAIDVQERVARFMTERLFGLSDRLQLERMVGEPTQQTGEIIDRITASAARKKFSVVSCGRGLSAVERCRPNSADLIERFFGGDDLGRAVYKLLSQVAHGNYVGVANRMQTVPNIARPGQHFAATSVTDLPTILATA